MSSSTLSSSLVLFFFFFICRPTPFFQPPNTQDSYSSLDSSSFSSFLPSSPSSNIQTHFSKSQKSRSQNRSKNLNPKIMISALERHGFDNLGTRAAWVCFLCFLVWFVSWFVFCVFWVGLSPVEYFLLWVCVFWVDVLGFFLLVGLFVFFGLLFWACIFYVG